MPLLSDVLGNLVPRVFSFSNIENPGDEGSEAPWVLQPLFWFHENKVSKKQKALDFLVRMNKISVKDGKRCSKGYQSANVCVRNKKAHGLAHATGVHERNSVPYARFALKKRHGFCAKAREKNMQRHRLGTL